jgi:hypothetical protein
VRCASYSTYDVFRGLACFEGDREEVQRFCHGDDVSKQDVCCDLHAWDFAPKAEVRQNLDFSGDGRLVML